MSDAEQETPASSSVGTNPPQKKKRRLLKCFIAFLILFFVLVALAPTIISSGAGTNMVLGIVNDAIDGSLEIESLDVGWFSGTSVEGLKVLDPEGKLVLTADVKADTVTIVKLAKGDLALGDVFVNATQCDLVEYYDGTFNLTRAFANDKPKTDEPTTIPGNLAVQLDVQVPNATLTRANGQIVELAGLGITGDIANPQNISIKTKPIHISYDGMKIVLQTDAKLSNLFDKQGLLDLSKAVVAVADGTPATILLTKLPTILDKDGKVIKTPGKLLDPVAIEVSHERVHLALAATGMQVNDSTANLAVTISPIRIDTENEQLGIQTLTVKNCTMNFDGPGGALVANVVMTAVQGDKTGTFIVKATINDPFKQDGSISYETLSAQGDVEIQNFALGLVDRLLGKQNMLANLVGPVLNASAKIDIKPNTDGTQAGGPITIAANAKHLDVSISGKLNANRVTDTNASASADATTFAAFVNFDEGHVKLGAAPSDIAAVFPKLEPYLAKATLVPGEKTATLTFDKIALPLDNSIATSAEIVGRLQIGKMIVAINDGEAPLQLEEAGIGFNVSAANQTALVTGKFRAMQEGAQVASVDLNLPGTLTNTHLKITPLEQHIKAFVQPQFISTLKKALAKKKTNNTDESAESDSLLLEKITLDKPVTITAKLTAFDMPIKYVQQEAVEVLNLELEQATVGLVAKIDQVSPTGAPHLNEIELRDFILTVASTKLDQPLSATFNSTVQYPKQTGGFSGQITLANLVNPVENKSPIAAKGNATLTNAPALFVDQIAGQKGIVAVPLYPAIEKVTFGFDQNPEKKHTVVTFDLQSKGMFGSGGFTLSDGTRINTKETKITLALSPSRLAMLQKDLPHLIPPALKSLELFDESKVTITANLGQLVMPAPKVQGKAAATSASTTTIATAARDATQPKNSALPILAKQSKFKVTIDAQGPFFRKQLTGNEAMATALQISNVILEVESPTNLDEVVATLNADTMQIPIENGKPVAVLFADKNSGVPVDKRVVKGHLNSTTTISGLTNDDGLLDPSRINMGRVKLGLNAKNLPMTAIAQLTGLEQKVTNALGNQLDEAVVKSKPGGDIYARIVTENLNLSAVARNDDKGIVITKDATASIHLNEFISEIVVKPMTGGLLHAKKSETPMKLDIVVPKEGMLISSTPTGLQADGTTAAGGIDWSKVSGTLNIDFGHMKVSPAAFQFTGNDASLPPLLKATGFANLLKQHVGQFLEGLDKYALKFESAEAKITKGVITYSKPLTFTFKEQTISISGAIDLNTQTSSLQMNVPTVLFGDKMVKLMKGKEYVRLPFSGPIAKPQLDIVKLATGLGGDVLSGVVSEKFGDKIGGDAGKILEGLGGLEGLFGGPKKKPEKNNQNKQPQQHPGDSKTTEKKNDAKAGAKDDDPLGNILNGIGGALLDRERRKAEEKRRKQEALRKQEEDAKKKSDADSKADAAEKTGDANKSGDTTKTGSDEKKDGAAAKKKD
jgi:hypothetical protein